jgi:hypothetical protein
MGHYLSGAVPKGWLRSFYRFPLTAELLGVGEMRVTPRFGWVTPDGYDDSTPFLTDFKRSSLPAWMVIDREDSDSLRLPTEVESAWFAKELVPPLTQFAHSDGAKRKGRFQLSLPFTFRLLRRDLKKATSIVEEALSAASAAPLAELNLPSKNLEDFIARQISEQGDALGDRGYDGKYLLLLYLVQLLRLSKEKKSVSVEEDSDICSANDVTRRRFSSRVWGSREKARQRLNECVQDLLAALEGADFQAAAKSADYGGLYANQLSENSRSAARLYLGNARIHVHSGALDQARTDLGWADHLNGARYGNSWSKIAAEVRAVVQPRR